MKRFFGGIFIESKKLQEAGIKHPIKLEYYKHINEESMNQSNKAQYGISIVKTEYKPNNLHVETKSIENITDDEKQINRILNIFKEQQVTIINSEEVMSDLIKSGI